MFPHVEGFDIAFNVSDRSSWKKYVKVLEHHLKREFGLISDVMMILNT